MLKIWHRYTFLLLISVLTPWRVDGALDITITQGQEGALPIAIVPFGNDVATSSPITDIADVVSKDLARSGRFAPLPREDLPGRPHQESDINFSDWRLMGTESLAIGRVGALPGGRYNVEFRLFDVFEGSQLVGFQFDAAADELRRTAHQISDIIYETLTGERGTFSTSIAYITESEQPDGSKRYRLNVADSDGENASTVLDSGEPVMSPAWSPNGSQLAYVSFEGERPQVYVQDLASGNRRSVASYPGINGAPAWSPDGSRLALTLSKDGNPEIYVLNLRSGALTRLTNNAAIDTESAWAPDGQSLVFTSDRGGTPQIYRISVNGGRPQRVTFEGTYNARAAFTPDGTKLALVHGNQGVYRIAVLDLENNALQVLTDTGLDESPSIAPNGSMILYATTDAGGPSLAAVSVDGRVRQRIAVAEGQVREPAWSPFGTSN